MFTCSKCMKQTPDGSINCLNCGAKVGSTWVESNPLKYLFIAIAAFVLISLFVNSTPKNAAREQFITEIRICWDKGASMDGVERAVQKAGCQKLDSMYFDRYGTKPSANRY